MTWDDVHERYPEQWVVLVETDWIENHFAFRSTHVIGHVIRSVVGREQGYMMRVAASR